MCLCNAFLASLLILLATTVTAEKSTQTSTTGIDYDRGRLLRKVDNHEANGIDTEERGVLSSIYTWGKTKYLIAASKTDDEVKKVLKMEGLTGDALRSHPNYNKLEKFQYKREGREMDDWLADGIPTKTVWEDLGLATMGANQLENSDALRKYVRYATKYDDAIWNYKNSIFEPPIYYGGSQAEMKVKVQIWAKAKRKDWYVEEMLGLDRLSKAKQKADPNYQDFLKLMGQPKK